MYMPTKLYEMLGIFCPPKNAMISKVRPTRLHQCDRRPQFVCRSLVFEIRVFYEKKKKEQRHSLMVAVLLCVADDGNKAD